MNGASLQDRISKGMGVAARRIGAAHGVYRPKLPACPLSQRNRIITLFAAFNAGDEHFRRAETVQRPVWWGLFDAAYTLPGDYLSGPAGTFFVASQAPLLPVECIKTNRCITVSRPAPVAPGGYSGMVAGQAETVLDSWPASVLALGTRLSGNLPETRFGYWSILLPQLPAMPRVADVATDETGRTFVVGSVEQTDMGWRLAAREVAG